MGVSRWAGFSQQPARKSTTQQLQSVKRAAALCTAARCLAKLHTPNKRSRRLLQNKKRPCPIPRSTHPCPSSSPAPRCRSHPPPRSPVRGTKGGQSQGCQAVGGRVNGVGGAARAGSCRLHAAAAGAFQQESRVRQGGRGRKQAGRARKEAGGAHLLRLCHASNHQRPQLAKRLLIQRPPRHARTARGRLPPQGRGAEGGAEMRQ